MFKMTRKSEYALLALQDLRESPEDTITKVREIATRQNIPTAILAKVMQRLARYDYVETTQGASGGYRIRPQSMDDSLWQFIEAMEGPQGIVDCMITDVCEQIDHCAIQTPLHSLDLRVRALFTTVQLGDFLNNDMAQNFSTPRYPQEKEPRGTNT